MKSIVSRLVSSAIAIVTSSTITLFPIATHAQILEKTESQKLNDFVQRVEKLQSLPVNNGVQIEIFKLRTQQTIDNWESLVSDERIRESDGSLEIDFMVADLKHDIQSLDGAKLNDKLKEIVGDYFNIESQQNTILRERLNILDRLLEFYRNPNSSNIRQFCVTTEKVGRDATALKMYDTCRKYYYFKK